MSKVARFLYYKIAAGELGERMSGHGTSGSVHGPCVRVQSYSGCGCGCVLILSILIPMSKSYRVGVFHSHLNPHIC